MKKILFTIALTMSFAYAYQAQALAKAAPCPDFPGDNSYCCATPGNLDPDHDPIPDTHIMCPPKTRKPTPAPAPGASNTNTNTNTNTQSQNQSQTSNVNVRNAIGIRNNVNATGGNASSTASATGGAGGSVNVAPGAVQGGSVASGAVSNVSNVYAGQAVAPVVVNPILGGCDSSATLSGGVNVQHVSGGFPFAQTQVGGYVGATIPIGRRAAACERPVRAVTHTADWDQCIAWEDKGRDVSTLAMCAGMPKKVTVVDAPVAPPPTVQTAECPSGMIVLARHGLAALCGFPPQPHLSNFTPHPACAPLPAATKAEFLATPYNGGHMTPRSLYRLRMTRNARALANELRLLRAACVPLNVIASSLDG